MGMWLLFNCLLLLCSFSNVSAALQTRVENGYTVKYENLDSSVPQSTMQAYLDTFFKAYPKMCAKYNPNCPKQLSIIIDPNYKGAAMWNGASITVSGDYAQKKPKDVDVMTHEGFHAVQAYPSYDPVWLVEGIADYGRNEFGIANAAGGWSIGSYNKDDYFTTGYTVSARFLVYLEQKYPGIVKAADAAMRNNTYGDRFWLDKSSRPLEQLWDDYVAASGGTPASGRYMIFYDDQNMGGIAKSWKGNGTGCDNFLSDKFNDRVESMNTGGGCVILYEHRDCQGAAKKLDPAGCGSLKDCCPNHWALSSGCDFANKASSHKLCSGLCEDNDSNCAAWAQYYNFCTTYSKEMQQQYCPKTCGLC